MGPYYVNFRAIGDDMRAHSAIRIAAKEELAAALVQLLSDRTEAAAMGARARQVFDEQAGATARSIAALWQLLPPEGGSSEPVGRTAKGATS